MVAPHRILTTALALCLCLVMTAPALAGGVLKPDHAPGIWFHWYAPSFYTGFAPREHDPERIHIHLGRGNQVRLTVVMDDATIANYLQDLDARATMIERLLAENVINLTMNKSWERFQEKLATHNARDLAARKAAMDPDEYRRQSLAVMRALNPHQVYHIVFDAEALAQAWLERNRNKQPASEGDKLALVNDVIPTRLWRTSMTPSLESALQQALAADSAQGVLPLLEAAGGKRYPVEGGVIDVWEYTTIYPVGTVDQYTTVDGNRVPHFPQTGVWPLTPRKQGRGLVGMVDYISTNPGYGFITMLPYQHAGGVYYNAFHNDGIRTPAGKGFIPAEWKGRKTEREGKPANQIWLTSRGPVSHGCTRLPSDLMGEFRNILPSNDKRIEGMPTYRNTPALFDVFDIDGDGTPEVMGVKYYIAYRTVKPRDPVEIRVLNTREAYYPWLYGKGVFQWTDDGGVVFPRVQDAHFVGRKALPGKTYTNIRLFEPEYHGGDKLQFYTLNPANFETNPGFRFNRELRKVGYGYDADETLLFLN